eukprot:CAMPEP_0202480968 /NCGR_PEP_ID=MMETSP1361-20130828/751_1 /ASSEMBLY_ACC=CAM_ASM_000849 /TAXON_ID=210615 /ORGANISM="Staurosira complex sp., Strain CCMP2646" /LENGTH=209 /DNA_ID=CAMNT_0049108453 /DNA_START=149 /DNA_END=778 /DNA_ORIENTATION=+
MASPALVTASHYSNPSQAPKQASGHEIRSRLLRRLGIHDEGESPIVTNSSSADSRSTSAPTTTTSCQQQRPAPPLFHVPLKYNNNNNQSDSSSSLCSSTSVGFQEHVCVIPIPMRTEYSERIRNRLWCSKHELHAMACRNLLEFEYEGWNPKNVLGDEYMIYVQGELVHPVHCRRLFQTPKNLSQKNDGRIQQVSCFAKQQQQQDSSSV